MKCEVERSISATHSSILCPIGRITVLGAPFLEWNGSRWVLPAKAFALISLLSVQQELSLPRSKIRDILWSEFHHERSNANLRQTLARVRKLEQQLGAVILRVGQHTIALNSETFSVDLTEALAVDIPSLVAACDWPQLEAFVEKFSGDLLSGVSLPESSFDDWREETGNRLRHNTMLALGSLVDGSGVDILPTARQRFAHKLLQIDTTHESAYRALMESYATQGDKASALQTYRRCCRVLQEELGVQPEAATRHLADRLGFVVVGRPLTKQKAGESNLIQGTSLQETVVLTQVNAGGPTVILFPPSLVTEEKTASRLSAALIEDVTSGLARYRSFAVVAPYTSARLAKRGIDSRTLSGGLDIRYAITTLIKPTLSGLAAVFRLTNGKTGAVLWAAEWTFELNQLPLLFDRLSRAVVYSVADAIERAELRFPLPADPTAYRLYLEGRANMRNSSLPSLRRARNWYQRSLNQFQSYIPALAGLSRTLSMERLVRGLTDDAMLKQALTLAERATELDPFDARGLRERGFCCLYLKRHDESLYSFQKAIELNPNDADLLADYADALAHSGKPEMAREMCVRALALNPVGPDYYNWILGSIYYQIGDYEAAIAVLEPVKHNPGTARLLAACSAMAGRRLDAYHYAAIVRDTYPDFRLQQLSALVPDKNLSDIQHLIEGLQRAELE